MAVMRVFPFSCIEPTRTSRTRSARAPAACECGARGRLSKGCAVGEGERGHPTVSEAAPPCPCVPARGKGGEATPSGERSEEHTSELQSLMRISYAVFCLKKKNNHILNT